MPKPIRAGAALAPDHLGMTTDLAQQAHQVENEPHPEGPAAGSAEDPWFEGEVEIEGKDLSDLLEEGRLNVEVLNVAKDLLQCQLSNHIRRLTQYEFDYELGIRSGLLLGGEDRQVSSPDEVSQQKQGMIALRVHNKKLRFAALETRKKLCREQRLLADLEQRIASQVITPTVGFSEASQTVVPERLVPTHASAPTAGFTETVQTVVRERRVAIRSRRATETLDVEHRLADVEQKLSQLLTGLAGLTW